LPKFPEIPGYQIQARLGDGSTATVWRAWQESLDRDVAIKILHPELWQKMEEADAFLAEARAVALLKSRHVIQVFDVGRLADTAYIVMEFVDGENLARHLARTGKMTPREALQIVAAVADALADAWESQGLIHRDIKPENIIIENDGSIKLADLGLARQIDPKNTTTDNLEIAGTPNYMSPEQATGDPDISFPADMYSLAATLYHMLTGRIPFEGMPVETILEAQVYQQLPWPQDLDPHIPLSCCQMIARMMMKNPQDRYPDWRRVYDDAVKLADGRVLMIKVPASSMSTVATPGHTIGGERKQIRVKKTAQITKPSAPPNPKPDRPPLPAWLSKTLHLARLGVIILLLWNLLLQPIQRAFQSTIAAPATAPAAITGPGLSQQVDVPAALPTMDQPVTPTGEYTWQDEQVDAVDRYAQEPSATVDPAQAVKQAILEHLVLQQYNEACQYWEQQGASLQDGDLQAGMARLLAPEHQPGVLIQAVLNRWSGRRIDLETAGNRVTLQLEQVQGDRVEALQRVESGASTIMRPYAFNISKLPPAEQIRLLENSSSLQREQAIGLVALQGGDYQKALEMAPHMGPLQENVVAFAQQQIKRLTQP